MQARWLTNARRILAHWATLEALIAACMDRLYQSKDRNEKVRLSAIEYRARMLRERAKAGRN